MYKTDLEQLAKIYSHYGFDEKEKMVNNTNINVYARMIIINYTDLGSRTINGYLRKLKKKQVNANDYFCEHLLNKALDEISGYNNHIVYRKDDPPVEFETMKLWYRKRIGQVVCFPNFLSTSKERWINNDKILKIHTNNSSSGRDLTQILDNAKAELEKEVLFKSRSKFKIIAVNEDLIELREVSRRTENFIMINDDAYFENSDNYEKCEESFLEKEYNH